MPAKTPDIEFIPQLHKSGCGIACVAMILGCDYWQALKIVHPDRRHYKKRRSKYATSILQISKPLKKRKVKFTVKFVDGHKLKSLKNPAILGVRWEDDEEKGIPKRWHAVVFSKRKILDPFTGVEDDYVPYSIPYCQKKTFVIFEIKGKRK